MPQRAEVPKIQAGGLVTVAFLKARLDEGKDHLGMFMPLVLDVLAHLQGQTFVTGDVQEGLVATHGVVMPQHTVATLLTRATKSGYLLRAAGRFQRNPAHGPPTSDVAGEKARIEAGQRRLGEALRTHAEGRGLSLQSPEAALDALCRYLDEQQLGLLLGSPAEISAEVGSDLRQRAVVAEFVRASMCGDPTLLGVLREMLEGMVLYRAAFLPDISVASNRFRNLRVAFDTALVYQAIGYEGEAARILMRDTVDILKGSGVQCLVFDKTVHEIKGILAMYERSLGTADGRSSLRPTQMTRHILTKRLSPSDVREMYALLERDVVAAGFQIMPTPTRLPEYTAGETALAARLADPLTKDEQQARVTHDVDCIAAVLTLRKGHRSSSIDHLGAVFVSSSPLVIRNTRLWWEEDEHETGIAPIVHVSALATLAWLKKPRIRSDFKMTELVALCSAALRPRQETWQRFLRHLEALKTSQRLTSDEVTAIVVSTMSDDLLREAELDAADTDHIDAITLDEIVDRVKASYAAKADEKVRAVRDEYEGTVSELKERVRVASEQYEGRLSELEEREKAALARAVDTENTTSERARQRELVTEGRARAWARRVSRTVQWVVATPICVGGFALILERPFHNDWIGALIGISVVGFTILELVGILGHVSEWRALMEARLTSRFRDWLSGDAQVGQRPKA
ncbi:MAG: hypothetical protein HYX92_11090 [Chloroflexi bacterium]|nr:hypothetical protein [Chloroflexota bacterium]